MRVAMVDVHGTIMCSHVAVVVAVKSALALASRPYGDEQPRVREVRGAPIAAGLGELKLGGAPRPR